MSLPNSVRPFARWLLGRGLSVVFLIVAGGLVGGSLMVGSWHRLVLLVGGLVAFLLAFRYYAWAETPGFADR